MGGLGLGLGVGFRVLSQFKSLTRRHTVTSEARKGKERPDDVLVNKAAKNEYNVSLKVCTGLVDEWVGGEVRCVL